MKRRLRKAELKFRAERVWWIGRDENVLRLDSVWFCGIFRVSKSLSWYMLGFEPPVRDRRIK